MPAYPDRRSPRPERGSTLIELLLAVAIMGIAFVIIVGGIATAILGSETQKEQAATDVARRTAAESITYLPCPAAGVADYQAQLAPVMSANTGITIAVTNVSYWDTTANKFLAGACADSGLHLIELRASPTTGKTRCSLVAGPGACEPLQVVKRRP